MKQYATRRPKRRTTSIVRALSKLGHCSRTQAIRHVLEGRVRVNGKIVRDPGFRCSLEYDRLVLQDKVVERQAFKYIMMNKPAGFVTTRSDEKGRPTVYDVMGDVGSFLFPVGRLDKETTGLLLMTNDHRLGDRLTDPKSHVPKMYVVGLDRALDEHDRVLIAKGIVLEGQKLLPVRIVHLKDERYEVTIHEGKNRQIRKMFECFNYRIISLTRISVGSLTLGSLKERTWRYLTDNEIQNLQSEI